MEKEYKKGTPVTVNGTGQEGTIIDYLDNLSKYLIKLNTGIAILMFPDEITPKE